MTSLKPDNLNSASISQDIGENRFKMFVDEKTPGLQVFVAPTHNGVVLCEETSYAAPILIRDVSRYGLEAERLAKHRVVARFGGIEGETQLPSGKTIADIIESKQDTHGWGATIKESTPVVHAYAFLPIASGKEFQTEYFPSLIVRRGSYWVKTVVEDREMAHGQLSGGRQSVGIKRIDRDPANPQNSTDSRWKAVSVGDLDEVDSLFVRNATGRMIMIALPYLKPLEYAFSDRLDYGSSVRSAGPTKSFSGGVVSIRQGGISGSSRFDTTPYPPDVNGHPVIYNVEFLGVKMNQAGKATDRSFAALLKP